MKYLVFFILLTIGLAVGTSYRFKSIDVSSYRNEISRALSQKLGLQVELDSTIIFRVFPTPQIAILGIKISYDDQLMIDSFNIVFNVPIKYFFNMLMKSDIEEYFLQNNESISVSDAFVHMRICDQYINEKIKNPQFSNNLKFTIDLEEGHVIDLGRFSESSIDEFTIKNTTLDISKDISIIGKLIPPSKEKMSYQFRILQSEKKFEFSADGIGCKLDLKLNDFNYEKLALSNGKVSFSLDGNVLSSLFSEEKYIHDEASALPQTQQKNDSDVMSFSADIISDDNAHITLDNIKFQGKIFKDPIAKIKLYKISSDVLESQVFLSASEIDLQTLKVDQMQYDSFVTKNLSNLFKLSSIHKNLNMNLKINVDKISLANNVVTDLKLHSYNVMGTTLIDELRANLPGKSDFYIHGVISSNATRQRFDGLVSMHTKQFDTLSNWLKGKTDDMTTSNVNKPVNFSASLFAIQNMLKMSDIEMHSDDTNATGDVILYDIPYASPTKTFLVSADNLDVDKFQISNDFYMYLKHLYIADSDKTGEKYFELTNTNKWIRCFDKHLLFEGRFSTLKVNDQQIQNIDALIDIKPSVFKQKISFNDPNINGELKLTFVLPVLRPQISANGNFRNLDLQFLQSLFKPLNYFNDDNKKMSERINFFSGNSYDFNLNIKIDDFIINDKTHVKDLDSEIKSKFGYISIKHLNYLLWNGSFKSDADVIISSYDPIFHLNFNVYNLQPKSLFEIMTGVDKIDGYMSLAGLIKGNLKKFNNQNIYGKINFEAAAIKWNGLDLNKVIEVVDGNYTRDSKIKNIDYYMNYGSTLFDSVKGSMLIKKGIIQMSNISLLNKRLAGVYSLNYDPFSKSVNGVGKFGFIPINNSDALTINTKTIGQFPNPQNNDIDYSAVTKFINAPAAAKR